jgi:hypothetical protein
MIQPGRAAGNLLDSRAAAQVDSRYPYRARRITVIPQPSKLEQWVRFPSGAVFSLRVSSRGLRGTTPRRPKQEECPMAKVSWNRTWQEKMRKKSRGKKGKNRLRKKKR